MERVPWVPEALQAMMLSGLMCWASSFSGVSLPDSPRGRAVVACVVLAERVLSDVAAGDLWMLSEGHALRTLFTSTRPLSFQR